MAQRVFDRETLIDLTVNVVPLGILLFFLVAFAVFSPWDGGLLVTVLQFAVVAVTALLLGIVTYYAGKAISTAERETEAAESVSTADSE